MQKRIYIFQRQHILSPPPWVLKSRFWKTGEIEKRMGFSFHFMDPYPIFNAASGFETQQVSS